MQVSASQTTYIRFQASTRVVGAPPPSQAEAHGTALTEGPEALPSELRLAELQDGDASLTYARSEKTSLRIRTQEGDIVRIKFQTRQSADLEAEQAADDGEGPSTSLSLATKSSSHISIKVRGNLNEAELTAISQAIDQAARIADSFFAGDVPGAFDAASALDIDAEQLARVSLRMRLRESLTYTASGATSQAVTAGHGPALGEVGGHPAGTPRASSELPAGAVAANVAHGAGAPAATDPGETVAGGPVVAAALVAPDAAVADEPVDASSPAPLGRPAFMAAGDALRSIGNFLSMLMDALQATDEGRSTDSVHISLKIRIVSATIMTLSEARAAEEPPVNPLVPETLDALAAHEQAHVDQVA